MGFSLKGIVKGVGKAITSPVGLGIAGTLLGGPLGGMLGSAAGKVPGLSKLSSVVGKVPGLGSILTGGGKDGQGNFGMLGDLLGNKDALLAGAGLVTSTMDRNRVNGLQNDAANMARGAYTERAPLRSLGLSMAQDQSTPSLGHLFRDDGNVYDRQKRGIGAMTPLRQLKGGA